MAKYTDFLFCCTTYGFGLIEIKENGNSFHIFDIEKTVVDIVYHRNKVGIEEMVEVLKNYLRRDDRNLIKFMITRRICDAKW